jgi:hypothetical protein
MPNAWAVGQIPEPPIGFNTGLCRRSFLMLNDVWIQGGRIRKRGRVS